MSRLVDSNPELFENETLGAATTSPFLDQLEEQKREDFNARLEGREPRIVVAEDRYPQFMPSGTVPSDIQPKLSYQGEEPVPDNDVEVEDTSESSNSDLPPEIQDIIDEANNPDDNDEIFTEEDFEDSKSE